MAGIRPHFYGTAVARTSQVISVDELACAKRDTEDFISLETRG